MLRRNCSGSLYELLNVSSDATPREVKKAYHLLALSLHPDKTGGQTNEEFKRIVEAQSVLTDPQLRRAYDMFGKSGVDAINRFGFSKELASIGVLRTGFLFLAFFAALVFIALELVIMRQDYGKTWSWPVTFTPLWISFLPVLLVSGVLFFQGFKQCRVGVLVVACELILAMAAVAIFVAGLAGYIKLSLSLIPFIVVYIIDTLRSAWYLIPSQFRQLAMGHMDIESVCGSRIYWGLLLETIFEKLCILLFLGLGMLRTRQTSKKETEFLSFWFVFAPLIVYFGAMSIVSAGLALFEKDPVSHEMPGLCSRVCRSFAVALYYGSFLYMSCMLAAKCNVEQNNALGGFHPSLAVALIPLEGMLALLVMIPCCMFCFVRSLMDAVFLGDELMRDDFVNRDVNPNSQERPRNPVEIIVPEAQKLRREYEEV